MANALTSWKEIGQYLGQRGSHCSAMELENGLPVRRSKSPSRAVLALPEELDTWTRTRMKGPGVSLVETLNKQMVALREETAELRSRVGCLEEQCAGNGQSEGRRRVMRRRRGLSSSSASAPSAR